MSFRLCTCVLFDSVCFVFIESLIRVLRWIRLQIQVSVTLPIVRRQVLVLFHELMQETARPIVGVESHRQHEVVLGVYPVPLYIVVVPFLEQIKELFLVLALDGYKVMVKLVNILDTL